MELISVIMSVYNEEEQWLIQCLDSLVNQSYEHLQLIIVLDNKSNETLKKILEKYQKMYSYIELVINDKNLGLTRSLNKALLLCKGDYIARMDADDICRLDRFEVQKHFLESSKSDFVYSPAQLIDEEGNIFHAEKEGILPPKDVKKFLTIQNKAWHPSWFAKKEVFDKLNGYRDVQYCEDYDFLLRTLENGYRISRSEKPLIYYRVRRTSISQKNLLIQMLNARFILLKYKKSKLSVMNVAEINEKFNYISEKRRNDFLVATNQFNKALEFYWNENSTNYIQTLKYLLLSIFRSKYIVYRIKELISLIRLENRLATQPTEERDYHGIANG